MLHATYFLAKESKHGVLQDGALNCVTAFRAVRLDQPQAVDMLFGDLSCQAGVVIVRHWSVEASGTGARTCSQAPVKVD